MLSTSPSGSGGNPTVKTCAVVQGNIRRGTDEVLACLVRHFDLVILSTWDDEPAEKIPRGNWGVVLSRKPAVPGHSHRNFQRLSTAVGLRRAGELGATHVLKWRTDMLPTRLDVPQLLAWSSFDVPEGMASRLVTCAFRNLTVRQDWFSTIPDLFAFADIGLMNQLWGDESFDYSRSMNIPPEMAQEAGLEWAARPDAAGLYCAEAELYAIFKSRLQRLLGQQLTHVEIAKDYMRLIDHRRLGVCWFGEPGRFRSISQALQHPWWTERTWEHGRPQVTEWGYPDRGLIKKYRRKFLTPRVIRRELECQFDWYRRWLG
ncbi:MAG: hypothetical protein ACK4J1_03275 [Hylemonella sp.]